MGKSCGLVGETEGNSLLGKPRCRWVNNIKMLLKEVGLGGVDWLDLVSTRQVVGFCGAGIKLQVPYNAWNFLPN
jgi:hypothetical protein